MTTSSSNRDNRNRLPLKFQMIENLKTMSKFFEWVVGFGQNLLRNLLTYSVILLCLTVKNIESRMSKYRKRMTGNYAEKIPIGQKQLSLKAVKIMHV
jgi:hypothetical protein